MNKRAAIMTTTFGVIAAIAVISLSCNTSNSVKQTTGSPKENPETAHETTAMNSYILDNSSHVNIPDENPAQVFYSGHGWQKTKGIGTLTDDTDDYVKGDRSLKLVTLGDKSENFIQKTGASVINYVSRYPVIWIKVDKVSNLASLYFTMSSSDYSGGYYSWSIKSQLQLNATCNHDNEWVPISLSFSKAKLYDSCDRSAINSYELRCTDNGSGVTVRLGAIGYYDEPAEGIVSLTFDDGWLSQYTRARQKMDEYGFAGTAYIIYEKVGTANYMTLTQLEALQNISGWSISCHSAKNFVEMSSSQLDDYFWHIKDYLAKNGLASGIDDVAYPNGAADNHVFEEARKFFQSGRSITEYPEYYPPVNPYSLRIKNITIKTTVSDVDTAIANTIAEKEWLILCFHKIEPSPSADTEYSVADFNTIIDHICKSGIKVRNVAEVLSKDGIK